ncbi:MAG: pilus assembly protein [Pseudolabrys sp.]|nr:pilus assembly protein [Pseudolabrys sp.]
MNAPNLSSGLAFLRKLLHSFRSCSGGNVAVIFSIMLVPLLGCVGAAVDYTRVAKMRSAMQGALDTVALMVSQDVSTGAISSSEITPKANTYFNALYVNPQVTGVVVTATYSKTSSTITVSGQGSLATEFLKVVGFPTFTFNVAATTTWSSSAMRVALALDNTGSMSANGKMSAMQTAAKNLVTKLSSAAKNPGDVYISLIPFAKDVNVGSANYNANWIDWTDWNAANYTMVCDSYLFFICVHQSAVPKNHNSWTGCVTDRTQNYDITNTAPNATNMATLFPAEEYFENGQYYCKSGNSAYLQPIIPLSTNWTALNSAIDAMQPTGSTNQPIGLAWAWQSLSQVAPIKAPAENAGTTYIKAIVLLSDGLNTANRWPAYGDGTTQFGSQIDNRQKKLCDNIKADGITIYTIQLNTGIPADPTSAVMQYCASDPSGFYLLTSATQVVSAFDSIGSQLVKLRISK